MRKTLKLGIDKMFVHTCRRCLSDFTYEYLDVFYTEDNITKKTYRKVICPECDSKEIVTFDEYIEDGKS